MIKVMYAATKLMGALLQGGAAPPVTDGYWKHYQTGVITPVYLSDPNISYGGTAWARPSWFDLASEIKLPSGITYVIASGGIATMPEALLVDLPATLTNYSSGFLGNTPKLITIIIRNPVPATTESISFGANIGDLANFDGLYVPSASISAYQSTAPWSAFSSFIKGF